MKYAVIGAGYIGKIHAHGALVINQDELLPFVLEPSFVVRRKETPVPCPYHKYLSIEEVLQKEAPDFFDICTPNDDHLAQVELLAAKGLPIYCEKPLADNKQSAKQMLELVPKKGILTGMAFNYRSSPAFHLALDALQKGMIGKVMHCDAFF